MCWRDVLPFMVESEVVVIAISDADTDDKFGMKNILISSDILVDTMQCYPRPKEFTLPTSFQN